MSENVDSYSSTNENSSAEGSARNEQLVNKLNIALNTVLEENKLLQNYKKIISFQRTSIFSAPQIPSISIKNYLSRIQKFTESEENTLISSLIYLDKLTQMSGIILSPYNIHRLLFIAILTSIKYNEDVIYNNEYYAKVAGITTKELNCLEFKFLDLLQFRLFISKEEFETYKKYLMNIKFNEDD